MIKLREIGCFVAVLQALSLLGTALIYTLGIGTFFLLLYFLLISLGFVAH